MNPSKQVSRTPEIGVSKSSSVNKTGKKSVGRWIVRRSGFPFTLPGKQLGVVEARDAEAARTAAGKQFTGAFTVEPETAVNPDLERVVERAVKTAARQARGGRGSGRSGRRPMASEGPDHG